MPSSKAGVPDPSAKGQAVKDKSRKNLRRYSIWVFVSLPVAIPVAGLAIDGLRGLYAVIVVSCVSLLLCVAGLPGLKQWRDANQVFVLVVVTIVGAFTGVFLGVILSTSESNRAERHDVALLLRTVSREADSHSQKLSLVLESELVGGSGYSSADYLRENPLQLPETFLNVMQSEMALRNISPDAFSDLSSAKQDVLFLVHNINEQTSEERIKALVPTYQRELISLSEIATSESLRLDGKIGDDDAARARQQAIAKKLNYRLPPEMFH